jgi:hypothetical protein
MICWIGIVRCLLLIFAMGAIVGHVGCTQVSYHQPVDAPADPAACKAALEAAIDRTCAVPADCVLVTSADCCGEIDLAVKAGTEGGFPSAEASYEACLACPPLGCAHQTEAEDGTAPGPGQSIVATCIANRCQAVIQ